jgi:hypothetical protein
MKKTKDLTDVGFANAALDALRPPNLGGLADGLFAHVNAAKFTNYGGLTDGLLAHVNAAKFTNYGSFAAELLASANTLKPASFGLTDVLRRAGAPAADLRISSLLGVREGSLPTVTDAISRAFVPDLSGITQKAFAAAWPLRAAWSPPPTIFDALQRMSGNGFLDGFAQANVYRLAARFDESMGTALRVLRDASRVAEGPFGAFGARALAAAMPLSGALRFTTQLRPEASFGAVAQALTQLHTKPLGLAAYAIGRADSGLSGVAAQALSVLAAFELDGDDARREEMPSTPIVSALTAMDDAVRSLPTDASEALAEWSKRLREAGWLSIPAPGVVISFLSLVAAIVGLWLGTIREQQHQLSALHSEHERAAHEARIKELLGQIRDQSQRSAQQPSMGQPAGDVRMYAVRHTTVLRVGRSTRSKRVVTVYPGDVLELLQEAGRYVRMRQYDLLSEHEFIGWAPKKYFKRLRVR